MQIIILRNAEGVAKKVSFLVYNEIKRKPDLVLGLASGYTMIPIYRHLVSLIKKHPVLLSHLQTFNLDEYVTLRPDQSIRFFMQKHIFKPLNISDRQIHFPQPKKGKLKAVCEAYEQEIHSVRGIDLQILGIGRDGHIAFNEPGSSFNSRTRVVSLDLSTRMDASSAFGSLSKVPRKAITLGISNILQAKKILLVATGMEKAEAVRKLLQEKVSSRVPATFLRRHADVLIVLDKYAASLFNKKVFRKKEKHLYSFSHLFLLFGML